MPELSIHDVGPSGRCCSCDSPTDRTGQQSVSVVGVPGIVDKYLTLEFSECPSCDARRRRATTTGFKYAGLGFAAGIGLAVASVVAIDALAPGWPTSKTATRGCTMSLALLPFLLAVVAPLARRRRSRERHPRVRIVRYTEETGVVEFESPHPENLRASSSPQPAPDAP
ncbi:MAG: hypothetical protein ACRBN8_42045 [Nannocystales bacterium]